MTVVKSEILPRHVAYYAAHLAKIPFVDRDRHNFNLYFLPGQITHGVVGIPSCTCIMFT